MAEKTEYVLRPTNGSSPVVITSASRRDTLLARGYTLVEGHPLPRPKAGQKRRKPKKAEE